VAVFEKNMLALFARFPETLFVAAAGNIGAGVALYANGDMVRSIGPTGYPLDMSGTSMAAPQVCSVAARLLSQRPGLSVAKLKRLLIDGADDLPLASEHAAPIKVLNPARSAALAARLPD
jgi:subtilisin family serine protease